MGVQKLGENGLLQAGNMGRRDELWGVDMELCLLSGTGPRASCVLSFFILRQGVTKLLGLTLNLQSP